ncbi:MAG: RecX family transcriptional regulator [Candidatus Saccharimonadales bacterium]
MKITAIKQQVKRPDRYSVFVDGKYAFSLSESALLDSKIANGQEIDRLELEDFKKLSSDDKVYGQALRYAALRTRSQWEMANYLKRKQVEPPIAQKIIAKLTDLEFLDDENFAKAWVANRRLLKPVSRRRLVQELKQKRVEGEIIEHVLAEDPTDETNILSEIIQQKRKQTRYQDNLKLMQYLARQGFNYDDIKSALSKNED